MSKSTKEIALQILNGNQIGVMATNNSGKPNSRYMTFVYFENKLYTVAEKEAEVMNEIKENPATHILLGYENDDVLDTFLEIEGHAEIAQHDVVKQQLLTIYPVANEQDYVVIQVTPTSMRIMNKKGKNQQDVNFV